MSPHTSTATAALRATLDELRLRRSYPSITLLVNTTRVDSSAVASATRLVDLANARLDGDVDDAERVRLVARLRRLVAEQVPVAGDKALALYVSPDVAVAVSLGRSVHERVIIDDTFATRDLVADINRQVDYQVITISERVVRCLIGDRRGVREVVCDGWPLVRDDELHDAAWRQMVSDRLRDGKALYRLPTVVAGVDRSVRRAVEFVGAAAVVGSVLGNHDRTSAADLHQLAWPVVDQWLQLDREHALARLDAARSARRCAAGIEQIWTLAAQGRIELVVVEDTYAVAARVSDDGALELAEDASLPGVVDDVVDEVIEEVLHRGGRAVIVPDGDLADSDGIAAILRY